MNEEDTYGRHLRLNASLIVATIVLSVVVIALPWHIGFVHTLVNGASLLALGYSYYCIQYHETRTLLRIFLAIDCVTLAAATPVAYG